MSGGVHENRAGHPHQAVGLDYSIRFDSPRLGRLTGPCGSPQVDRIRRSEQAALAASISGASAASARPRDCRELALSALARYWVTDAAALRFGLAPERRRTQNRAQDGQDTDHWIIAVDPAAPASRFK